MTIKEQWELWFGAVAIALIMATANVINGHIIQGIYKFITYFSWTVVVLPSASTLPDRMRKPVKLTLYVLFVILWLAAAYIDFINKKILLSMFWIAMSIVATVVYFTFGFRQYRKEKKMES